MEERKIKISEDIALRKFEGSSILIPITSNIADFSTDLFSFNKMGEIIWGYIVNGLTISEIINSLKEEYDIEHDKLIEEVNSFITLLFDKGFLELDG